MVIRPEDETFQSVEPFIYHLINRFRGKYNVDYLECVSAAGFAYTKAYNSYNPEKGSNFTTWVAYKVNKELINLLKVAYRDYWRFDREYDLLEVEVPTSFNFNEFLDDLSKDAQLMVELTLQTPDEIKKTIANLGCDIPSNMRYALSQFLQDLGWSKRRIYSTMKEIRSHL